jgi:hypothetical protein
MTDDQSEQEYREIVAIYDMANELASTSESEFVVDQKAQLDLVEPLIDQVHDAADALTEEYIDLLRHPTRRKSAKGKVEGALRKIFMAIEQYRSRLAAQGARTLGVLANIADPVVEKIRAQSQKIILIFMRLVEISLERIMHKSELEDFRRSNLAILPEVQLGH